MKKNLITRIMVMAMILVMSVSALAGCGDGGTDKTESNNAEDKTAGEKSAAADGVTADTNTKGGKILFLSSLTSGIGYEANVAYLEMACENLGYTMEIVYGDGFNDPAGNLAQVKNAMTSDVVGLIAMQDGGLNDILMEYPELYVVGFMSDMAAVFDEDGTNSAVAENDHFLGTMADGHANGTDIGQEYFDVAVEKGYKKIAIVSFPPYAFPLYAEAVEEIKSLVEEYNASADAADQIEIVGDTEILNFEALSDSWFNEPENQELDAIIGLCAGGQFIYPTMVNAIANGAITTETKLITSGFEDDEDIIADFGDDGVIQYISIGSTESMIYSLALLDNAIQGTQYADYTAPKCVDSAQYIISSREIMDAVVNDSAYFTCDMSKLSLPWEEAQQYFVRYNPDATLADLEALLESDQLTEQALIQ